jgi:hypothetical protein
MASTPLRVAPRARSHGDRAGDPLDGLVNLFDLAIVLAVAFLLAALSSLDLSDLLTSRDVTIIRNPGKRSQTILVKRGAHVQVIHLNGREVAGQGTRVGAVYRLSDGRLVYVPGAR